MGGGGSGSESSGEGGADEATPNNGHIDGGETSEGGQ